MNTEAESNSSQNSSVNSQVIDSIKEINNLLKEGGTNLDAISNQILTQATGMAMLNVVNQQQQLFMLQNTVTTVAAKAMLESSPLEAVKLMDDVVKNSNAATSIKELQELINEMKNEQ
jgi:hypothetical protein